MKCQIGHQDERRSGGYLETEIMVYVYKDNTG